MKIEIDQSGKIEKTSKHTFLAFSNGEHFVLKISSTEKKKLQKYFRNIGRPKIYIYATFSALIVTLLKNLKSKNNHIIIDIEYPGKNEIIKNYIKLFKPGLSDNTFNFHYIGIKSRAHYLAYGTAIKKLKPDLIVGSEDILKIIKKSESA